MARVVVIGGIESTFSNAQAIVDAGCEIVMFYTRGENSPGWEGVALIDEGRFPFAASVPRTVVQTTINKHIAEIKALAPDFIFSLGWQQMYRKELLDVAPVIGIHESLLPAGAGAVPIANAILHDVPRTGVTLFWLDGGVDTGPIAGQLAGLLDPRTANASELYLEAMELSKQLLAFLVPQIKRGTAPRIPQDLASRTVYGKVVWSEWPQEKVRRARVYPYG